MKLNERWKMEPVIVNFNQKYLFISFTLSDLASKKSFLRINTTQFEKS